MQHVAMIMDGNRRWARERKFEAVTQGHRKGVDTIEHAIQFCLKNKIKHLSLYALSYENFLERSDIEKKYLFSVPSQVLKNNIDDLIKQGIRIRFVGDRTVFPEVSRDAIHELEEKTKHLDTLNVNLLFCYGSKQELVFAAKKLAKKVQENKISVDQIDEKSLRDEFWLNFAPDPEMIIRTGKVSRISNFLLFHGAYSEWMFLDCYWPEITEEKLQECYNKFYGIKRNFGA